MLLYCDALITLLSPRRLGIESHLSLTHVLEDFPNFIATLSTCPQLDTSQEYMYVSYEVRGRCESIVRALIPVESRPNKPIT